MILISNPYIYNSSECVSMLHNVTLSFTFKVFFQEVWIQPIWNRAGWARITRVTLTVGASYTCPMATAHILTLRSNVNIV